MANKYISEIPFERIERIQIYVNKQRNTLASIKKATGADFIINGSLFNMSTYQQYCNVKADGVIQYDPHYSEFGFRWNTPADFAMDAISAALTNFKNYIGCVPLIVHGAKQTVKDTGDLGGKRGRTAIGIKGNSLVLYCSKDGTSNAAKPSVLRNELFTLGCTEALMLDGGGSSQCNLGGNTITSARRVANLILVYLKKTSVTPPSTSTGTNSTTPPFNCPYAKPASVVKSGVRNSNNARWVQWVLKNVYNYNIEVDGSYGPATTNAVKDFQKNNGLTITGNVTIATRDKMATGTAKKYVASAPITPPVTPVTPPSSTTKCPYATPIVTVKYGNANTNVRWVQWMLKNKFGYNLAVDGHFGNATLTAVKQFQKSKGLAVDGYVGPATRAAMLK